MKNFFLTSWSEQPSQGPGRVQKDHNLPETQIDIGFCVLLTEPPEDFDDPYKIEGHLTLRAACAPNIGPREREKWVRDLLRESIGSDA